MTNKERVWDEAPEWVEFIAVDADGEVWGYNLQPQVVLTLDHWISPDPGNPAFESVLLSHFDKPIVNWKDTLESRDGS